MHYWNDDEDIHRFTLDAEFIGWLKLGIETDTFGNKDVYRYRGNSMVEQTELDSYGHSYSPPRVTASHIEHLYGSEEDIVQDQDKDA